MAVIPTLWIADIEARLRAAEDGQQHRTE